MNNPQVEQFVAPKPESVEAVNTWLAQHGISASAITPAGDWLSISVPVSKANELFDAEFGVFTHSSTGKQAVRTLKYSIPADLEGHLDFVHPTISFPNPNGHLPVISSPSPNANSKVAPLATCSTTAVTPGCIQTLYGIPTTLATQTSNVLGVSGFIDQFANQADLTVRLV